MVVQKSVDLNLPLSSDNAPTLEQLTLDPHWALAAVSLHADYYRQLQLRFNEHVLLHRYTQLAVLCALLFTIVYSWWDLIVTSFLIGDFINVMLRRKRLAITLVLINIPIMAGVIGTIAISVYFFSDVFKLVLDKLVDEHYCDDIFGFPIIPYAKSGKEVPEAKNTQLVVYRGSPIAVASIVVTATSKKLSVRISGLHCRKAFRAADFDGLLVDWAISRARELHSQKAPKLALEIKIDAYTFDHGKITMLEKHGFVMLEKSLDLLRQVTKTESSSFVKRLYNLFGLKRVTLEWADQSGIEIADLIPQKSTLKKRK